MVQALRIQQAESNRAYEIQGEAAASCDYDRVCKVGAPVANNTSRLAVNAVHSRIWYCIESLKGKVAEVGVTQFPAQGNPILRLQRG